jgi:hypothetical protein
MSRKTVVLVLVVVAISLLAVVPTFAAAGGRPGSPVVVYVRSQGLYYDSIVGPELPPHGRFQILEMGGPTGLQTEYGPGDHGYVGGRWWLDKNEDGVMDEGELFSCPLLGPGRTEP